MAVSNGTNFEHEKAQIYFQNTGESSSVNLFLEKHIKQFFKYICYF